MSERVNQQGIPDNLRPLFEAKTAHRAVGATLDLLNSSSPDDQARLLHDPTFRSIVASALTGLDECRRDHALEIVGTFAKRNQNKALRIFFGEANW